MIERRANLIISYTRIPFTYTLYTSTAYNRARFYADKRVNVGKMYKSGCGGALNRAPPQLFIAGILSKKTHSL